MILKKNFLVCQNGRHNANLIWTQELVREVARLHGTPSRPRWASRWSCSLSASRSLATHLATHFPLQSVDVMTSLALALTSPLSLLLVVAVLRVSRGLHPPGIGTSLDSDLSQVLRVSGAGYLWELCSQAAQGGQNIIYPIIQISFTAHGDLSTVVLGAGLTWSKSIVRFHRGLVRQRSLGGHHDQSNVTCSHRSSLGFAHFEWTHWAGPGVTSGSSDEQAPHMLILRVDSQMSSQ